MIRVIRGGGNIVIDFTLLLECFATEFVCMVEVWAFEYDQIHEIHFVANLDWFQFYCTDICVEDGYEVVHFFLRSIYDSKKIINEPKQQQWPFELLVIFEIFFDLFFK